MPYISTEVRPDLDPAIGELIELIERAPGADRGAAFNYAVSRLVGALAISFAYSRSPLSAPRVRYVDRAEAYGHLMAAAREFERRVLDAYESPQPARHGDVPEYGQLGER